MRRRVGRETQGSSEQGRWEVSASQVADTVPPAPPCDVCRGTGRKKLFARIRNAQGYRVLTLVGDEMCVCEARRIVATKEVRRDHA